MKLMSGRKYKNDLSDVIGILREYQNSGNPILYEQIEKLDPWFDLLLYDKKLRNYESSRFQIEKSGDSFNSHASSKIRKVLEARTLAAKSTGWGQRDK